jgi:hypothetical protein
MPCGDVTELLRVQIDGGDRITNYQLQKLTCGRGVGDYSLLAPVVFGRAAAELASMKGETFAEECPAPTDEEMFLRLKHFFALQSGLRVLLGLESGAASNPIKVARVACEDGNTVLEAEIEVDVITEQIKACGKCKGCGTLRTGTHH